MLTLNAPGRRCRGSRSPRISKLQGSLPRQKKGPPPLRRRHGLRALEARRQDQLPVSRIGLWGPDGILGGPISFKPTIPGVNPRNQWGTPLACVGHCQPLPSVFSRCMQSTGGTAPQRVNGQRVHLPTCTEECRTPSPVLQDLVLWSQAASHHRSSPRLEPGDAGCLPHCASPSGGPGSRATRVDCPLK